MKRPALLSSVTLLVLAACGPPRTDVVVHLPGAQRTPALVEVAPSTEPAPEPPAPAATIAWETSDDVARERAKTRGAPLLVFAFASWATAAVRMDRTTWADARVVQRARPFIALRLDVSEADANAQVGADGYDLRTIPSVVLLDEHGHEITRLEGYVGSDEVLAAMGRVMPDH